MFNMTKIRATSGAGKAFYMNHLSANDYYSEGEQVVGKWRGSLASDFGLLMKEVNAETFSLFQQNINPVTMGKLTQRNVLSGVRFFDFQCAAPKSVSVLSLFDDRLILAHRDAMALAMGELEKLAAVRVRNGDNVRTNNYEITGNILYASFLHDASRALDPQLHTHNVVANVTRVGKGEYKALESLEMYRALRYAGKVYHNELAKKCHEMGYRTENQLDEKGNIVWFNIAGVSEEIMEVFSKRRAQIEAMEEKFIEEHGRKPTLTENNFISMTTRDQKLKEITKKEVKVYQLGQLSFGQRSELDRVISDARRNYQKEKTAGPEVTVEMIRAVLPIIYERDSVLKLDKVLAEALNQNLGKIDLKVLKTAIKAVPELKNLGGLDVNPYFSTEKIIQQELYAIEAVEGQMDLFKPIAEDFEAFPGQETRRTQAELIHGMLSSKDRFSLFRGVAGAGKTSTLQELCNGLRSGGIESIHLIAPTNSAVDVLRQEGFEQSQTVASFLLSPKKPPAGSYVIIDESGLNSLREGVEIVKMARANNYRVLFVGDARQHNAVESGDFFRLLEGHSQIERFSLTDIHRQRNEEYRRGISECATGNFEQAFTRFDENGFIHEGKGKYLDQAADSYMEYTDNGQFIDRAILVAPTHDEGDKLTEAVRSKLKTSGSIKGNALMKEVFRSWNWPKARLRNTENYRQGMTVAFIRNMKDIGKAGETATILDIQDGNLLLDNGKELYAKRCAEFIEVGEKREIELCEGDLIQFSVNLRDRKIYNGNIAMITAAPGKVLMLHSDGKPRELIDLPEGYDTFKYGWVTTSHKSQGRTAENVVVAAQSLDRKAFYVALSRGRQNMALHCPEKDFLKSRLAFTADRDSIHDLLKSGEIRQDALLNLSPEAREVKAKLLPDTTYKSIKGRAAKLMETIKDIYQRVRNNARKVSARRARFNKYGYGIVTEQTYFEQGMNFAVEAKTQNDTPSQAPPRTAPAEQTPQNEKLKKLKDFIDRKWWPTPVSNAPSPLQEVSSAPQPVTPPPATQPAFAEKKIEAEPKKPNPMLERLKAIMDGKLTSVDIQREKEAAAAKNSQDLAKPEPPVKPSVILQPIIQEKAEVEPKKPNPIKERLKAFIDGRLEEYDAMKAKEIAAAIIEPEPIIEQPKDIHYAEKPSQDIVKPEPVKAPEPPKKKPSRGMDL